MVSSNPEDLPWWHPANLLEGAVVALIMGGLVAAAVYQDAIRAWLWG